MYKRRQSQVLEQRLREPRRFIQVLAGPRCPCLYAGITTLPGMDAFAARFPVTRRLLVGARGIPLDEFLATPPEAWLSLQ